MKRTDNDDLKAQIIDNLEIRCQRIFGKPLPAILDTAEVSALGIRPKSALDNDSTDGIGLPHLPGTGGRGRPRKYLLSTCVDSLVEGLSHQGGTAA